MSIAYYPQIDGLAERTNPTIEQVLRCSIHGDDFKWVELLPVLEFGYNSTVHSSTRAAPSELLYFSCPTNLYADIWE